MITIEPGTAETLDAITYELLGRHRNSIFRAVVDDRTAVELLFTDLSERKRHGAQEQFSLLLHGPCEPLLPQRTYRFEHERIGCFAVFIVPVGKNEQGYVYQVVFNRILTSSGKETV